MRSPEDIYPLALFICIKMNMPVPLNILIKRLASLAGLKTGIYMPTHSLLLQIII